MILYVVLDLAADELDGLHGRIVGRFARAEPQAFRLAIVDDRRANEVIHADSWAGAVDLWRRAWLRLNGPRLPSKAIMAMPDGEPSGEPSTADTGPHGASLGVRYIGFNCCPATWGHADQRSKPRSHRGDLTRLPEAAACDFGRPNLLRGRGPSGRTSCGSGSYVLPARIPKHTMLGIRLLASRELRSGLQGPDQSGSLRAVVVARCGVARSV
jgi:hypothetical protein